MKRAVDQITSSSDFQSRAVPSPEFFTEGSSEVRTGDGPALKDGLNYIDRLIACGPTRRYITSPIDER